MSLIRIFSSSAICPRADDVIINLASQSLIIYSTSEAVSRDEIGV